MSVEKHPRSSIYEIYWPTAVTEPDLKLVRGYIAEGWSPEEGAARTLVEQAIALRGFHIGNARDRLIHAPQRFSTTKRHIEEIIGSYAYPANILIEAKAVEARGVQMPPLLDPRFDELLSRCIDVTPGATEAVRQAMITGSLNTWQRELSLLGTLQKLGPLGLVDAETDQMLAILNPNTEIGRRCHQATELGRQRLHQLVSVLES